MSKPRPTISELRARAVGAESVRDVALGRLRAVADVCMHAGVRHGSTQDESELVAVLVLERDALSARVAELEQRLKILSRCVPSRCAPDAVWGPPL